MAVGEAAELLCVSSVVFPVTGISEIPVGVVIMVGMTISMGLFMRVGSTITR